MKSYIPTSTGWKVWHTKCVRSWSQTDSNNVLICPPEIAINRNNITKVERAILEVHKRDEESLFSIIEQSPFWGIMHDGITKFQKEFNGVAVLGIRTRGDANARVTTAYALPQLEGGVNAHDIGNFLFIVVKFIFFISRCPAYF